MSSEVSNTSLRLGIVVFSLRVLFLGIRGENLTEYYYIIEQS